MFYNRVTIFNISKHCRYWMRYTEMHKQKINVHGRSHDNEIKTGVDEREKKDSDEKKTLRK